MYDDKINGHSSENKLLIMEKEVRVHITNVSIEGDKTKIKLDIMKLSSQPIFGELYLEIREKYSGKAISNVRENINVEKNVEEYNIEIPFALNVGNYYSLQYSLKSGGEIKTVGEKTIQITKVPPALLNRRYSITTEISIAGVLALILLFVFVYTEFLKR